MEVKWNNKLNTNEVLLPNSLYKHSLLGFLQRMVYRKLNQFSIRLGMREKKVSIKLTESKHITLSPLLFEDITIPTNIPYEVNLNSNSLELGPVIALIVSRKKISTKKKHSFKEYLQEYSSIKGLIYICSSSDFNHAKKRVKGYYYLPSSGNEAGVWVRGVFPYPSVVYRRVRISTKIYNLLVGQGAKIFNGIQLNKWSLWDQFHHDLKLRSHLPYTAKLNQENCKDIVDQYRVAYIKPIRRAAGKGIRMVEKKAGGYLLKNRHNKTKICRTETELYQYIQPLIRKGNYIIQQGIPFHYENSNVDFRVIMQRNILGQWICTGIIARYGKEGFICTNEAKVLELGTEALQKIFQLTKEEAKEKEQEIIRICNLFCYNLDTLWGGYADLGIDVLVDHSGHVWVLEINILHQHIMAKTILDNNYLYNKVITTPLRYAKSLSEIETP